VSVSVAPMKRHFIEVPDAAHYWLLGARVPLTCLEGWQAPTAEACLDSTVRVDLEVRNGRIAAIDPASCVTHRDGTRIVDLRGSMVFPTFVDLHTHIGAPPQGCLGSHGSVTGATAGCARAAKPAAGLAGSREVFRRACSYGAGYTSGAARADKSHTCERSRNPTGSLSGADRSTARDAAFWDRDDVFRRGAPAMSSLPLAPAAPILQRLELQSCLPFHLP